jgi:transposase-like protein
MARKQPRPIQMMTNSQWEKAFPDEDACDAYLVAHRWPDGVYCPRCGSTHVYKMLAQAWKWECMDCGKSTSYRFSDITWTIFENTNVDLRKWFRVIHLMLRAKKGVSALQVQRFMGFGSYKTAWYMCHRIRVALQDTEFQKLMGIVEVDETFIGGKSGNRHKGKRGGGKGGGGGPGSGKAIVAGAVERKGSVVARVIADVGADTLNRFIREAVSDKVSLICTDQWTGYKGVGGYRPHASVDHAIGEYIRHDQELVGAVHTQTIEGFWSIFKRQVIGTHHKISRKYLPLYVAECQFKYNNRQNAAIFETAIAGC